MRPEILYAFDCGSTNWRVFRANYKVDNNTRENQGSPSNVSLSNFKDNNKLPAVLVLSPDGKTIDSYGQSARGKPNSIDCFKPGIGSHLQERSVSCSHADALRYTGLLLKSVLEDILENQYARAQFGDDARFSFAYPAHWEGPVLADFKEAVLGCFDEGIKQRVRFVSEPDAALLNLQICGQFETNNDQKEIVLIVDVGGSTTDLIAGEYDPQRAELMVLGREGAPHGGMDYDEALLFMFLDDLRITASDSKSHSELEKKLRNLGEDLKEGLSDEITRPRGKKAPTPKMQNFALPFTFRLSEERVLDEELCLDEEKFRRATRTLTQEFAGIVTEKLAKFGLKEEDVAQVVLVGGGVRLFTIEEHLKGRFKRVIKATEPEEAVVRGVALEYGRAYPPRLEVKAGRLNIEEPRDEAAEIVEKTPRLTPAQVPTAEPRPVPVGVEEKSLPANEVSTITSPPAPLRGTERGEKLHPPSPLPYLGEESRAVVTPSPRSGEGAGGEVVSGKTPAWLWVLIGVAVVSVLLVVGGLLNNAINSPQPNPTAVIAQGVETATPMIIERVVTATAEPATATPLQTSTPAHTSTPLPTGTPALRVGSTQVSSKDGMVMVYVPAGEFIMGSDTGAEDEKPQRTVTLDAFWIDQTEVTNAMYARCFKSGVCRGTLTGRTTMAGYEEYPVVVDKWEQAQAYCGWVGRRLPTEAEWEKAARGTNGGTYPWGEGVNCEQANYGECKGEVQPVGSYPDSDSPYSTLDMSGNVWEYVQDLYPGTPDHILKGGDWFAMAWGARAAVRGGGGDMCQKGPLLWGASWGGSRRDNCASWAWDWVWHWAYPRNVNGFRCVLSNTPVLTLPPSPTLSETTAEIPSLSNTPAPTLMPSPAFSIGSTQVSSKDGMVQVYVPAGEFLMGSENGNADEKPQHTVDLDAYWIDKTEVTNGMYAQCDAAGSCTHPANTSSSTRSSYYGDSQYNDYPVIYVDWNQANAYCRWAGRRLPTEAEWEKAARGTDGRTYSWGEQTPTCSLVNYGSCEGDTTAVGSYPGGASVYGALDMAGNVWEWASDWYSGTYYANSPSENPQGPGSGKYRVLRGGSWFYFSRFLRSSVRFSHFPDFMFNFWGFRCALSP